jgi:hypothetical protein
MSWGCVSYMNSCFVSNKANMLVIGHQNYANEYDSVGEKMFQSRWFADNCNKKMFVGHLPTNIDDKIINLLNDKISELIKL